MRGDQQAGGASCNGLQSHSLAAPRRPPRRRRAAPCCSAPGPAFHVAFIALRAAALGFHQGTGLHLASVHKEHFSSCTQSVATHEQPNPPCRLHAITSWASLVPLERLTADTRPAAASRARGRTARSSGARALPRRVWPRRRDSLCRWSRRLATGLAATISSRAARGGAARTGRLTCAAASAGQRGGSSRCAWPAGGGRAGHLVLAGVTKASRLHPGRQAGRQASRLAGRQVPPPCQAHPPANRTGGAGMPAWLLPGPRGAALLVPAARTSRASSPSRRCVVCSAGAPQVSSHARLRARSCQPWLASRAGQRTARCGSCAPSCWPPPPPAVALALLLLAAELQKLELENRENRRVCDELAKCVDIVAGWTNKLGTHTQRKSAELREVRTARCRR